jgi:hypothetical protein
MGFFKAAQRRWTGRVVKDYGVVSDRSVRGAHRTLAVVLSEHDGPRIYVRESWRRFFAFAFRVNFIERNRDEATRLRAIIDDALGSM